MFKTGSLNKDIVLTMRFSEKQKAIFLFPFLSKLYIYMYKMYEAYFGEKNAFI